MSRLWRYLKLGLCFTIILGQVFPGRALEAPNTRNLLVYVPVAAFPTVIDDIKWADVQRYWQGDPAALSDISGTDSKGNKGQSPEFVTTATTLAYLTGLLGEPAPSVKIEMVAPESLSATLWKQRPTAWAIVPFDRLDPTMKVLTLDGASVFNRNLDLSEYPLVQSLYPSDNSPDGRLPTTNRDLAKMTILVMTGTTSMVRATAYRMETRGITYPAQDIAPFMADADFVHVSNEVAFATDCPYPDPTYIDTTKIHFCSKDSYLDLLKAIHVNIVELTGNHVEDWGPDALNHTLDVYNANHIDYFGGGRNTQDARKALIVTHNGNTIAFIGCNVAGPKPAWATESRPGAAQCDDDYLSKEIPRLKGIANVVVMTLQYFEYYQYDAPKDQIQFFQKYADWGANMVMGSQGHWPQGFAVTDHSFIHYGVGNLFFDQMDQIGTRQTFVDKFIIYNGRLISIVLFTGMLEDYSRPRPMTFDERTDLLQTVFKASGW